MEHEGRQGQKWQEFYECAWATRADLLREYLKDGCNAYQACKRLETIQRKKYLEYDQTDKSVVWRPFFTKKEKEFIRASGTPLTRRSSYQGNYIHIPFYTTLPIHNMLIDIIDEMGPFDSIIELGCGYGQNLFNIYYEGGPLHASYFGGEFTDSGVAIATELAKASDIKATFFHFNHLKPELLIDAGTRALVFTNHSIEQVEEIPENWFSIVSQVAPKVTCVHFEPFGFQIQDSGPVTKTHHALHQREKWNQNFSRMLGKAVAKGTIQLECCYAEVFFPQNANNPASLAIWHSENKT